MCLNYFVFFSICWFVWVVTVDIEGAVANVGCGVVKVGVGVGFSASVFVS